VDSVDECSVRRALLSSVNLLQLLHCLGVVLAAECGECALTFELDYEVIETLRLECGQFDLPRVVNGNIARGVGVRRGGNTVGGGGREGLFRVWRRVSLFVPHRRLSS